MRRRKTSSRNARQGRRDGAPTPDRRAGDVGVQWVPAVRSRYREERLVVVVPPSHRLAGRSRLRLADLAGEELVTTRRALGNR